MRFFLGIHNQQTSGIGLSLFRILYSLVLIIEVSQLIFFRKLIFCLFESPTGKKIIAERFPDKAAKIHSVSRGVIRYSTPLLGIHPHGVFMDWHFSGYNHIVSVTHRTRDGIETRLPLIDERGMPTGYNFGRFWVYYTFRANAPNLNSRALALQLRDITAF